MYASRFYAFLHMETSVTHLLKYFSLHSFKLVLPFHRHVFRFLVIDEMTSVFLITFHFILCFTPLPDVIFF